MLAGASQPAASGQRVIDHQLNGATTVLKAWGSLCHCDQALRKSQMCSAIVPPKTQCVPTASWLEAILELDADIRSRFNRLVNGEGWNSDLEIVELLCSIQDTDFEPGIEDDPLHRLTTLVLDRFEAARPSCVFV